MNSLKKEASGLMGFEVRSEPLRIDADSLTSALKFPLRTGAIGIGLSWVLLGVTGRAKAVGEPLTELIIGDELSDADGMSFKLSKVLNWSTATCGEASIVKFGLWITSSSGTMCKLSVGLLRKDIRTRRYNSSLRLKKSNEKYTSCRLQHARLTLRQISSVK